MREGNIQKLDLFSDAKYPFSKLSQEQVLNALPSNLIIANKVLSFLKNQGMFFVCHRIGILSIHVALAEKMKIKNHVK